MSGTESRNIVQPVDVEVGGDADFPGIAQPVTLDDIQGVAFSDQALDERRQQLMRMRDDIVAKRAADGGDEMAALIAEFDRVIALLDEPEGETASRAGLGMIADERADTSAPDER